MVVNATKAFDDLKYWYADLANSLSVNSERQAAQLLAQLNSHMEDMQAFAPDKTAQIIELTEELSDASLEALDAYILDDFAEGNRRMEESHLIVSEANEILDAIRLEFIQRFAQDGTIVSERSDAALTVSVAIMFATAFISIISIILVITTITQPIRRLTGIISAMAQGDLTVDIVNKDRGDEISDMAMALEVFRLQKIERRKLEKKRAELAKSLLKDAEDKADQAYGEMERSVRIFQILAEHASDMIALRDNDGKYFYFSPST